MGRGGGNSRVILPSWDELRRLEESSLCCWEMRRHEPVAWTGPPWEAAPKWDFIPRSFVAGICRILLRGVLLSLWSDFVRYRDGFGTF